MKHTALYLRVSTEAQADEGYSLAAQAEKLEAYCRMKGIDRFTQYVDGGFSGSNLSRPAVTQLIDCIRRGEVERVVVSKSVRVLGPSLFYGCERLREVVFEPGSSLERIREQCFKGCGLEQICLPKSVWCIEGFSFSGCKRLSQLSFEKRSKLRYVGDMAFRGTRLTPKDVKYPRSLKAKGHGSEW